MAKARDEGAARCSSDSPSYPYADAEAPDLAGGRARNMSSSSTISSKPPPHPFHVNTDGSAAPSSPSPRPSSGGSSGGGSGQNQACAACKYQRRKCNPDCPLARYFPADKQRLFLNAHRLFGVSNIQKTLRRINPEYGPEAMRAIIYQSEARASDPVYGCVSVIKKLEHQIHVGVAELEALRQQIAFYQQAAAAGPDDGGDPLAGQAMLVPPAATGQDNVVMTMNALYGIAPGQEEPAHGAGAGFTDFHYLQQAARYNAALKIDDDQDQPAPLPLYTNNFCYDGTAGNNESTSHDGTVRHEYCYSDASVQQTAGSPGMTTLGEQLKNHCRIEAAPPFGDAFDVKPQDLHVTVMEHHSRDGDVEQTGT